MTSGQAGSPVVTARALVEAVVARDADAALALVAPDVLIRVDGLEDFEGYEGLRRLLSFQTEIMHDMRVEIRHALGTGESVAIDRTEYFTVAGEAIALDVGAFLTVREGLVVEWIDYQDLSDLARAMGH